MMFGYAFAEIPIFSVIFRYLTNQHSVQSLHRQNHRQGRRVRQRRRKPRDRLKKRGVFNFTIYSQMLLYTGLCVLSIISALALPTELPESFDTNNLNNYNGANLICDQANPNTGDCFMIPPKDGDIGRDINCAGNAVQCANNTASSASFNNDSAFIDNTHDKNTSFFTNDATSLATAGKVTTISIGNSDGETLKLTSESADPIILHRGNETIVFK